MADWVTWLQAIVLGLVQGITEFLPISSTAHLILFSDVLGWKGVWHKTALDAMQFGSVIAVFWYFWPDLRQIVMGAWQAWQQKDWQRDEWKLLIGITVGTLPALGVGFILKQAKVVLDTPEIIATMAITMAVLLGLAEKFGSRKRAYQDIGIWDGILVGCGQVIALLPGASRSGSTLTTALFLGLNRETAARFSFLLGIPTLTIATLVQAKDVFEEGTLFIPLLVAIVSSMVFSYLAIAWLLKFLQRHSTWVFIWYRIGLGVALWGAIALGSLQAAT
ncbi:undecaprenyl-diphosphate phosphatase [Synechococcus sp. PCC 6717]|jgi:undecaprenyl-diphosphatase|uniref:Undecaprenyl-diphosphatase n=1 Tax=Parathermosynechococcus lividus PCC 6715 TaxID=1917166 RepID=A0A2D2PZS5_PARLV|nr:undecaprenyl-diphosphate phosphatase [Thermostichus lividus]ATS17755.1 undecaprenyl-diphosphatase [Thermostichus lividus PCC 6715]MCH9055440.1 undecaprenyl-diphosphate phosphatase [Synechococcus sp. PCC 6716]MCI3280120.1 undecaprenyl-diphosphate phosphatase [Synechococcus sp. PCC 6717]